MIFIPIVDGAKKPLENFKNIRDETEMRERRKILEYGNLERKKWDGRPLFIGENVSQMGENVGDGAY